MRLWEKFRQGGAGFFPSGSRGRILLDRALMALIFIQKRGLKEFLIKLADRGYLPKQFITRSIIIFQMDMLSQETHIPLSLDAEEGIKGEFICPMDNLAELQVFTSTYRRRNADLLLFVYANSMNDKNKMHLRKVRVNGRKIKDNGYTSFAFKPIPSSGKKLISFELKSTGTPAAAVLYNPELHFNELKIQVNNRIGGSIKVKALAKLRDQSLYGLWIIKNEPSREEMPKLRQESLAWSYRPRISIITPVFNTDPKWLDLAIKSVINQTYDNWDLCIADGCSTRKGVKNILESYARKDGRIKVKFLSENKGIGGNSNEALSLATGDFVLFLDHDDELAFFALHELVKLLNQYPDTDLIYSDEDKITANGHRTSPTFKPDWSPDFFLSVNYIIHITAIRKMLMDKVGGFPSGYDGAQDYALFLKITEHTGKIRHIPRILYHWRTIRESSASFFEAKPYAYDAGRRSLLDAMSRRGIEVEDISMGPFKYSYRITYSLKGTPDIGIIIPTKDRIGLLRNCLESIFTKTTYPHYHIILVDNRSERPETLKYYELLKNNPRVKILNYAKPFNFSAINNYAAKHADSEYLLFLNNDIEVISKEWLATMLSFAQRRDVGAVGAKLCYPDDTIQHAGVILGIDGVAGHSHKRYSRKSLGYLGRIQLVQNVSAVTAACMMMRKDVFDEVRGFSEDFEIACGDVDLCLKIRQKGYLIVYNPYAELYHHESASRGFEDAPEKRDRFAREKMYMKEKWGDILTADPYYNPNLTLHKEDFSIRV
ncbi:MAG: glycosyltransferase family 2 protein [Deltaproteobacteria bacterium]|nr:glycosyltransferase family 2 protein [Deltaproteobacteria bacterium]MBW2306282.1 glycosyltransferase family 2 protein [Deltaproteobacteria bacterium]